MGHAHIAVLSPYCAAVAAKVAPVCIIVAAAKMPFATAAMVSMAVMVNTAALYSSKAATMPIMTGRIQLQLSATKLYTAHTPSNTCASTTDITEKVRIKPFTVRCTLSLLASWLTFASSGSRALIALFFIEVHISLQVLGILSNLALVSSAQANIAAFTISAVICPSAAISLSLPFGTSIYFAMACIMFGACSRILLYSSPRSTPEPIACVSCNIAASMPCAEVPAILNCLFTCSIKAMVSLLLLKASPAISPSFATASAVARYEPLDLCAEA